VVLNDSTLECINRSETTATKWHIKREDNLEKLVDGRKYLFQVRCKTGCGFGAANAKFGFYSGTLFFVLFVYYGRPPSHRIFKGII